MDSKSKLVINTWLTKADENYVSGRALWMNSLVTGASNLLWLSCEQLIKTLKLQLDISELSSQCETLDELHDMCDKKAKGFNHKLNKLILELGSLCPEIEPERYKEMLEKLNEYFFRRYVKNSKSHISLGMLDMVDEFYFTLRSYVSEDVQVCLIDEIFYQKKNKWGHPLPSFSYAYLNNKHFRSRPHPVLKILGPDRKLYQESGRDNA